MFAALTKTLVVLKPFEKSSAERGVDREDDGSGIDKSGRPSYSRPAINRGKSLCKSRETYFREL